MQLIPVEKTPATAPTEQITDKEGAAMARAAVNLFRRWEITDAAACTLLGGVSEATYSRWKRGAVGRIGVDLKTRLSLLMGIHKALRILFSEPERVYGWIKLPNAAFDQRSALDVMLQGQITDLLRVRYYLDAARG